MSVTGTLAALGRLLKRTPPPPDDVLEAYAHEVVPVLDRAEWLYQYWLEQSTLFSDSEKLGNVAAIHRWETASMGRSLERVIPPGVLASAHEDVLDALDMASRAAQLLSSGSRFHNANAVCEGQALLAQSRERRLAALQAMRRYLAAVMDAGTDAGPADPQAALNADPAAARPAGLAEAAAFVSVDADDVQAASEQPSAESAHTEIAAQMAAETPAQDAALPAESPAAGSDGGMFAGDQGAHDLADHYDDDDSAHDYAVDEHHYPDDDEEDALPWLTRLAEQEAAGEQPSVPPVNAPSEPSATAPGPAQIASPVPVPEAPPAPQPPPGRQQGGGGWGSLFRRAVPPAPGQDGEPPPAPG